MAYPDVTGYGLRIPYDLDGSVVMSYSWTDGYTKVCNGGEMNVLNSGSSDYVEFEMGDFPAGIFPGLHYGEVRILFSIPIIVTAISLRNNDNRTYRTRNYIETTDGATGFNIQGSTDARALTDGFWTDPLWLDGVPIVNVTNCAFGASDDWRNYIWRTNFTSGAQKAIRVASTNTGNTSNYCRWNSIQVYGIKQTSFREDLDIVNIDSTQEDTLLDYGEIAYPSTYQKTFYIQNLSPTKVAKQVRAYGYTEQSGATADIDVSFDGSFNPPLLSSPNLQSGTFQTTTPPQANPALAQEIPGMFISVTVQRPCYIDFYGEMYGNGGPNSGYQALYVDTYRDDFYLMTTKVWTINAREYSGGFTFRDYIETIGVHTYNYKVYAPGWDAPTVYALVDSAYMSISWAGSAAIIGNIGPRQVVPVYSKAIPGAGTVPIARRYYITNEGFSAQGYGFCTTQAKIA